MISSGGGTCAVPPPGGCRHKRTQIYGHNVKELRLFLKELR